MTTSYPAGRALTGALLRAAAVLRQPVDRTAAPVAPQPAPPGWDRLLFDARRDGDPLEWLGFRRAHRTDRPRFEWPRPARWPTGDSPADRR